MMDHSTLIASLALFTLLTGMAVAAFQLRDANKAKKIPPHPDDKLTSAARKV